MDIFHFFRKADEKPLSERLPRVTEARGTVARPDVMLGLWLPIRTWTCLSLDLRSTFRSATVQRATQTLFSFIIPEFITSPYCTWTGKYDEMKEHAAFILRWKTLWSSESRTRDKCMSCFSTRMTTAESQDKQTALWELSCAVQGILGRGSYLFNLSLSDHCFSLYLSKASRKYSLSLWGFLGRGKRLMSSTSRWQRKEREE